MFDFTIVDFPMTKRQHGMLIDSQCYSYCHMNIIIVAPKLLLVCEVGIIDAIDYILWNWHKH